jgi:hypothetical protein
MYVQRPISLRLDRQNERHDMPVKREGFSYVIP